MPEYDFSKPQRQSGIGLILIFTTVLYHLVRNLWVIIVYFLVREVSQRTLLLVTLGVIVVLLLSLLYSIAAFFKFKFHIDQENREFVLQKGVFSSDVINVPFSKIQQVNFKRNLLQRVIGVYSIVIETAGSQQKEVEIKALSQDKANELSERLMNLKHSDEVEETSEDEIIETNNRAPKWHFKVGVPTLLKLGLTSNYLRGVAIIITFYFTLREQFMLEDTLPVEIPNQSFVGTGSLVFIMILLLIGMFITIAETVIKYYDLNLKRYSDALQVEMGLRTNTRISLKENRVQLFEVVTNPLQQWLDLYQLKLSLASSENDLKKSQIKIPGLPPNIISEVKDFFFKTEVTEKTFLVPHKIYLLRKISRGMIPAALGLLAAYFYQEMLSFALIGGILSIYVVLLTVYNFFYYRRLKLSVSDEFLVKYSGIWNRRQQYIEMYRLQSISIQQPIWYKRRGLVNLTFHSAAGDIRFPVLRISEVQPLINYLLYKIESTSKEWM